MEVGSLAGEHTRLLLDWCETHDARLHSVDPAPAFESDDLTAEYSDLVTLHRAASLDVLGTIERPDVALIDGDHNWYTVFHELELLNGFGSRFPLVLLHDVGWPWGRRDAYYDPERIPPEFRHPVSHGGLVPGASEADPTGGFVTGMLHAVHEGGPRNGVLTAVEDFMAGADRDLELVTVPGLFGYGALFPRSLLEDHSGFAAAIGSLRVSDGIHRHLESLEWWRVQAEIAASR